jgi:hypothetical protein
MKMDLDSVFLNLIWYIGTTRNTNVPGWAKISRTYDPGH